MTAGQTWVVASLNSGFQIPDSLLGCLLEIESTSMRMQACSWDAAASTLVPSTPRCFSVFQQVSGHSYTVWCDRQGAAALGGCWWASSFPLPSSTPHPNFFVGK